MSDQYPEIMGNYGVCSKAMAALCVPLAGMHQRLVWLQNKVTSCGTPQALRALCLPLAV